MTADRIPLRHIRLETTVTPSDHTTACICGHPPALHRDRDGWCLHVDCECVGTPTATSPAYDAGDAPPATTWRRR